MGVVLFGTKETNNYLNDTMGDSEYKNVTSFHNLEKINLNFFRRIDEIAVENQTQKPGDLMDGLIVGIDMLSRHCGNKKFKKRIFLITDGEKEAKCSDSEMKTIITNMNTNDIRLNVISLDFCNDLAEDEDEDDEEPAQ